MKLFVHHHDAKSDVGEKYVISNAFNRFVSRRSTSKLYQVYAQYKVMLNSCDLFNRNIRHRKLPHHSGGNTKTETAGHCHNNIMASPLQNLFAAFRNNINSTRFITENVSFKELCTELTIYLYNYALQLRREGR
jgi:hypothetical protein